MDKGTVALVDRGNDAEQQSLQSPHLYLIHAALQGDYKEIERIIEEDELSSSRSVDERNTLDVNGTDEEGMSALHWGSAYNEPRIVSSLLLHSSIDANRRNRRGFTPLHYATLHSSYSALRLLLKDERVLKNAVNEWGESALHLAAQSGDAKAIKILLMNGVDSSITDKWGKDVFQVAEAFGELEAVEMLQKTEWSDDEDTNNDNEEQHANHDGNDIEVTKSRVLSKMMEAPLDETLFRKHLQSRDVCVNGRDFYGNSAVHKCAAWNKDKALNLLLNHPELDDPTAATPQGQTPLHMAVESGAKRSVTVLVTHPRTRHGVVDVNENMDASARDSQQLTPLHYAKAHMEQTREERLYARILASLSSPLLPSSCSSSSASSSSATTTSAVMATTTAATNTRSGSFSYNETLITEVEEWWSDVVAQQQAEEQRRRNRGKNRNNNKLDRSKFNALAKALGEKQ